jgi:hypothetical protein
MQFGSILLALALNAPPALAEASVATELEMNVVLLQGSGWTEAQAREQLSEAARIYGQCGISLRRVTLIVADPPGGRVNWNRFGGDGDASISALRRLIPGDGLTAFLTGSFIDENIDDAFAFADWRDAYVTRPELSGTVFLSDRVNSRESVRERAASPYSVLAHEMLHVLLRTSRHNGDPEANLMSDWRRRNNRLPARLCDAVAASPLLKPGAP